jgi:hypothetical protein
LYKRLLLALGGQNQLMKRNLEFQIGEFLELLQEFDSNSFEFGFGLFRV